MNATGGISPIMAPSRYMLHLILSRNKRALANVTRAKALPHCVTPPGHLHEGAWDESGPQRRASHPRKNCGSDNSKKHLNRMFLCWSKLGLARFIQVKELIQPGKNLRDLRHTLASSLNEPPLWEVGSKYKKNNINNMSCLKNHAIEITPNDDWTQHKSLTSFGNLIRLNYIKVSSSFLDQCLRLNANPEFFNKPMIAW
ncbi:hypothetical protein OOJ96_22925 [Pseudomonas sp. 15FMM2]|uniref:Uncharacterized protein n=1 Tax=Pseudomonas imrae TaxID=2992837 RepID=A0ACC7PKV1_9PSED